MTDHTPPHLDSTLSAEVRADLLLAQMTLAEKAGQLFHEIAVTLPGSAIDKPADAFGLPSIESMITERNLTHFNVLGPSAGRAQAEWHNRVQEIAASTRLGIPVTVSTDPRHSFTSNPGASMFSGAFSQWPESLGLAATRDINLIEQYADTVRQEYLAVGFRVALHPQIDLATEPRWARAGSTFGEDAALTSEIVAAYIRGMHGGELGAHSVATMIKHFPGGGPQKDGEDPHFPYGREQVYPGDNFDYHLKPFIAAIAAGATQMMPYYGMPIGLEYEEVAFGFNKGILTGLLREKLGYTGIICSDWGILTDGSVNDFPNPARAWGVEHLSEIERVHKAIDAGVDQFGGESCPALVVELVESGALSESRVDESVRRLLVEKFRLGLFDNRYVDEDAAEDIVGRADFVAAGFAAQQASIVVLKDDALPIANGTKLWLEAVDPAVAGRYGDVVTDLEDAELAIVRLETPYEPRFGGLQEFFHAGSLEFPPEEKQRLLTIAEAVPTVFVLHLDRAVIVPELDAVAAGLVADFGASDAAVLDVLFAVVPSRGRLPFDLPSSTQAVIDSASDLPFDTKDPLYRFGDGKQ